MTCTGSAEGQPGHTTLPADRASESPKTDLPLNAEKPLPWLQAALFKLFRRGRRKHFRSAPRFRFWLGLGSFLDFFLTFVLVSHVSKFATNEWSVNSGQRSVSNRSGYFFSSGACPR